MTLPYAKLGLMAKAVFLDRDETLNPDPGYISDPNLFELYPWVASHLYELKKAGFLVILVSNQSGIGRGLIQPSQLEAIHQKLHQLLPGAIDEIAICPHTPDDQCECRKPKPKLILDAAIKYGIDLKSSFMIGDRDSDYQVGINAGLKHSYLIKPGDQHSFEAAIQSILNTKSESS